MGACKHVRVTERYSYGYTDMRNVAPYERYEDMRNAYAPPPERRIVLPGEVYRYVDEGESDAG